MRNRIFTVLAVILMAASAVFLYLAWKEHQPFEDAKIKQNALQATVIKEIESADQLDRQIDFVALKQINPDIVGWIYVPQVGIDAPILKGSYDEEYLKKDFEGSYSQLGSIFTYSHTSEQLTDMHLCLFAHNMPSGQMFGQLSAFYNAEFLESNPTYWIYTPERAKEVTVELVQEVYKTDVIFQDEWTDGTERNTVTLSTCAGYGATPYRITVTGAVTREKVIL